MKEEAETFTQHKELHYKAKMFNKVDFPWGDKKCLSM
jgi:hypothetical protein